MEFASPSRTALHPLHPPVIRSMLTAQRAMHIMAMRAPVLRAMPVMSGSQFRLQPHSHYHTTPRCAQPTQTPPSNNNQSDNATNPVGGASAASAGSASVAGSPSASASVAALDASLPNLNGFDPNEDPKVTAARLFAEENAHRESEKKEWRSYFLTHALFWCGSFVIAYQFGWEWHNPFDPELPQPKPRAWTWSGPITPETPKWWVAIRRAVRPKKLTPEQYQEQWLDQLKRENELAQKVEEAYKAKYGHIPDDEGVSGVYQGQQALFAAMAASEVARREKNIPIPGKINK